MGAASGAGAVGSVAIGATTEGTAAGSAANAVRTGAALEDLA